MLVLPAAIDVEFPSPHEIEVATEDVNRCTVTVCDGAVVVAVSVNGIAELAPVLSPMIFTCAEQHAKINSNASLILLSRPPADL